MNPTEEPATRGTVAALWRYPVKSMLGEKVAELEIEDRGAAGDRAWALENREGFLASGKDSARFRRADGMMLHRATLDGDGAMIEFADGTALRSDDPGLPAAIAEQVGEDWSLTRDPGSLHFDAAAIHLITDRTLATLARHAGAPVEPERVRPNILLAVESDEDFPEDAWVGRELTLGEVRLRVEERTERCVMTTQRQRDLPRRPEVLKTIGQVNEACAGIYAEVIGGGTVRVGDRLRP